MGRKSMFLVFLAGIISTISATEYTVGGIAGWNPDGTNYTLWAEQYQFYVGDVLVFGSYFPHEIYQVTPEALGTCNKIDALAHYTTPAAVALTGEGAIQFEDGDPGHCNAGMKLSITVLPSSSSPPSVAPPSQPSAPPSSEPSISPPSAPSLAPASLDNNDYGWEPPPVTVVLTSSSFKTMSRPMGFAAIIFVVILYCYDTILL